MPLDTPERALLDLACAAVPPPARQPAIGTDVDYPNYVENLMLTVLDLQLHNVIVNNAITHYRNHHRGELRTLDDLEATLGQFGGDAEGNRAAAKYLWGYNYSERLGRLRDLTVWARRKGLTDQPALVAWAYQSEYGRDWEGQIKGLGPAAYCWLRMRVGVDTVKPDSWLHGFLKRRLGAISTTWISSMKLSLPRIA